jgi:hypothetical protein
MVAVVRYLPSVGRRDVQELPEALKGPPGGRDQLGTGQHATAAALCHPVRKKVATLCENSWMAAPTEKARSPAPVRTRIVLDLIKVLHKPVDQRIVERIEFLGTVQRQDRDCVASFAKHKLGHRHSPLS